MTGLDRANRGFKCNFHSYICIISGKLSRFNPN
jgi:hypothetical protein